MTKRIFILYSLLLTVSAVAQYPAINAARPRIYADQTRIAWMQTNHNAAGNYKTDYDNFVTAYTNNWINDPELYLLGTDQSLWTWDYSSQWAKDEGFFTIYIYKVSNNPQALERCKFIAQKTIDAINSAEFDNMEFLEKETFLRTVSEVGGLLLDWCYTNLPIPLRDQLVQALFDMNTEFMDTYILNEHGTSYVSSHNTWNNIICNQNALVLHGASSLTPAQQATVTFWYQTIYDKHVNSFIPCWSHYREDDGGWNWGAAYSMWSLTDQFQLFENMRIGTTKNFYADLPWIQHSINQYLYFMQPDNKCLHLGDGQMAFEGGDRVMYLHARRFNDPRSKWLAQYWSQPENIAWTKPLFDKLFYKDYTTEPVTQPANPLHWFSDKVGLSIVRSSWDSDATMVSFFNSPSKRAAHEHRDNNSFTLYKNAPLLLDSGFYDTYAGSHYSNYYERTVAHNTICVFDGTESFESAGQEVSNDGGQIESLPLQNINDVLDPANKRGEWIQNAVGSNYQYNVSDAQQSYNPAKLDFFRRRLLYLQPNKVIVLDHVHLVGSTTEQRDIKWIAHFANEPNISGSVSNTPVAGHITTHDGQDYTASNGGATLAIRTVLPATTNTTRIGGTGYEYWVDGQNYPPSVTPDLNFYTPGGWRIEVKPTAIPADGNVTYLHTIDVGDEIVAAVPGGVALQNSVSVGTDWNNTIYFFPADGLMDKEYHVFNDVMGGRSVAVFAADLVQGTYNVKVDGTIVSTLNTDANGILQAPLVLAAGNHTIEVSNVNLLSVEYVNNLFTVSPNPAHGTLTVTIHTAFLTNEIEIFNTIGQSVLKVVDKQTIDLSALTNGVYIVKAVIDGKSATAKFIKK
ncbi:MAG TPA: heparinase II/III family protein [Flavobacterium sp.]|jgi:hypothetical protein